MTWRRLRVILQHLPPESHTMTALRNVLSDEELAEQAEGGQPEKARWSQLEQLVAIVADHVKRLEYTLICANTEKASQRPPVPEPIRRPGAKAPKKTEKLTEASAETLFRLLKGGDAA